MEIKLNKDQSLLLKGKTVNIVFNPTTILEVDVAIFSQKPSEKDFEKNFPVIISGPGEYEIKGAQIFGFATSGFVNYRLKIDGLRLALVVQKINQNQEEIFSDLDVLLLPLDNGQNLGDLVLKLEPKIVAVYKTPDPKPFLKDIARVSLVPSSKLVVKKDNLPAELEVVWLA